MESSFTTLQSMKVKIISALGQQMELAVQKFLDTVPQATILSVSTTSLTANTIGSVVIIYK